MSDAVYRFLAGPMVWISFGLFFAGLAWRTYAFFSFTKKREKLLFPKKVKKVKRKKDIRSLHAWGTEIYDRGVDWVRTSVAGTHPVMTIVMVVFHVLLFVIPIFLLAHNTMADNGVLGFGLPAFPEGFSDFLTVIMLLCLGVFLFRRIFLRRVRSITSGYDYFVLLVTAAPFITGFIAYHQWFDYRTMIIHHMIAGELMLILIPFTRLGHALFFFLYRFFISNEYSFGQGKRTWTAEGSSRT